MLVLAICLVLLDLCLGVAEELTLLLFSAWLGRPILIVLVVIGPEPVLFVFVEALNVTN